MDRTRPTTIALVETHIGGALAVAVQSRRSTARATSITGSSSDSAAGVACVEEVLGLARAHGILDGTAGGHAQGFAVVVGSGSGFDGILRGGTAGVGDEEPAAIGGGLGESILPNLPEGIPVGLGGRWM